VGCDHCGLEVPSALVRQGEPQQFCCSGCRQVHDLIHAGGYDQYYRLVEQQRGVLEPASVSGRAFDDFDDPGVQGACTDATGAGPMRSRLYLEGVHCAACVWLVERLPEVVPGLTTVRLNLASSVAEVVWQPGQTSLSAVGRALDALGYTPHVHRADEVREARRAEDRAQLVKLGVAAACAMNLMFLHGALYAGEYQGMATPYEVFFRWLSLAVSVPVMFFSARPFFHTALTGLRNRVVHVDLPIALALAVAWSYGAWNTLVGAGPLYFDSLAALVAALLGARQVQRAAQRTALERADSLRGVAFVEFARKLAGEGPDVTALEVPVAALTEGDRVEVRSGELVPVDGVVLVGRSSIDNAVLTGESTPVAVREGDVVSAGATNLGARLVVRVAAAGSATRVGALFAIVQEALAHRPAVLQWTDRVAKGFVFAVLGLSVVTGLAWAHAGVTVALERVVALLVITCPCALGLATPVAVAVGLMRAARAGIFVKNPDVLQRLRRVDTVLLDKTGTLTVGRAALSDWLGDDGARELAVALEAESSHPVAVAFRESSRLPVRVAREVSGAREAAGLGITGVVDGRALAVGNRELVDREGAHVPDAFAVHASGLLARGLSPVYVAVDGEVAGVGGVGDPLRDDARVTLDALRRLGVRPRIVSGDHPAVVARVAEALGVPQADARGGLTPEDKRDLVAKLTADPTRAGAVVMVGDGVNDAAALALADVGVAVLGGSGASIAAADVVLTREGVAPLLEILRGSRRVLAVIRRNLAFSLLYNLVSAALALAGLVGPLLAAVLMPISSLAVVLSSTLTPTFRGGRR
jgi:Cu2+-exporting ATPase